MLLANMGYDLMFRHLVDQIGARLAPSARRSLEHSAPQYPRRTLVAGGRRIARGNKTIVRVRYHATCLPGNFDHCMLFVQHGKQFDHSLAEQAERKRRPRNP